MCATAFTCSTWDACWPRGGRSRSAPIPKWFASIWETSMNGPAAALLRVEGLTVRYGAGPVVHGIGLRVADGMVAALLGANGAGKSSVLRAIAGLEPAQGRVWFDGSDITALASAQRFRRGIVYVPEGRAIVGDLSVAENLKIG